MNWRSGLVLLIVLSISLFTSAAAVPHEDQGGVSVTFVDADTVAGATAPEPARAEVDLRLQPSRY